MQKILMMVCLVVFTFTKVLAQDDQSKTKKATKKAKKKSSQKPAKKATPKSKDPLASCQAHEGLLKVYQDKKTGKVYLKINKDQLNKEMIYHSFTVDGVSEAHLNRGMFRDNKVLYFRKVFDHIELVEPNIWYYFDPKSALSNAKHANITDAIIFSQKIKSNKGDDYIIEADKLFKSEIIQALRPNLPPTYKGFKLGKLNPTKSKTINIRSYPNNTDVVMEYVFDNYKPMGATSSAISDRRYITIKFQHSFIEMPDNDFVPTIDDPRVGYFTTEVNDMTTKDAVNYRDLIHKWDLQKKDPNAQLSEPVQPIVFWIEKTTPQEYRQHIINAGLAWNKAFEKAGFKNAIQMKIQPDDAEWDAGDIRYNVLRWTSSPKPPFGGYGPSFVNPRTGQILGADIMLEYVFMTNRVRLQEIYDRKGSQHLTHDHALHCSVGHELQLSTMFGSTYLSLQDRPEELTKFMQQAIYYLVLHEMGHTLGLNHNMKASQLHSPAQLKDQARIDKLGLLGSVMDYPLPNIAQNPAEQTDYFTQKPGPYDHWAIEFAYGTSSDPLIERNRRQKVLSRSTEPELTFGNDADDMRAPGKAIDPRVMIFDLSSDMIAFGKDRFEMIDKMLPKLLQKYQNDHKGESYHELRNRYYVLTSVRNSCANAISRYIGGIYVDRAFVGQKGAKVPYTPVSKADQKRAMKVLKDHVFAPKALETSAKIFRHLQPQRRGFDFFSNTEEPKVLSSAANLYNGVLAHVLHPNTLARIANTELLDNQYTLSEMMGDLTDAIFQQDLSTKVNPYRKTLQKMYITKLLQVAGLSKGRPYTSAAQGVAFYQLEQIKKMLKANKGADTATKAHRAHIVFMIEKAMDTKS